VRPHCGWRPKAEEQTPCCAFGEADPNAAQGCMCGMDSAKWSRATEEVVSQPYWGIVVWDCGLALRLFPAILTPGVTRRSRSTVPRSRLYRRAATRRAWTDSNAGVLA
jgi:hypothetical protein